MKCTIPEISWHNREPVLSIDIHPISEKFYRLATGGADCHVLIWQLNICDNGAVKIEALSDLTRHQKAVNSVRWAPAGQYLATADDDANIIIWQLKTDNIPLLEGESNDKETWIVHKVMRGHKEDIYDLCWSPNNQKLLSGSIDNTAILWDFAKGKNEHILTDHKGFVQGVSWDPKSHYIATISTDRICRIYESSGRQIKARIQKGYLPVPKDHYLHNKDVKFFHDDTFKSFFRRLDFSPDGSLLAVPSGRVEIEDCKKILNATYIFAVDSWAGPVAVFPSGKQCSTVVRFCPILFELHEDGPETVISLPFRMIVAVGTDHDVILYDTQQVAPFAYFKDIHYTRLTDLTWSKDGLLLVASSTDGFCALITFEPNELGVHYVKEESEIEDNVINISGCEELEKEENLDASKEKIVEASKPRKPNLLEQWTIKTPKRKKNPNETQVKNTNDNIKDDLSIKDNIFPKRIKPQPVSSSTNNENIKPVKVSPLLNFLKGGLKDKVNDPKEVKVPTPLPPVNLILDEIEARDAWKCEKNENGCSTENNKDVIEFDEYTEEFSLHLDDTNTTEVNSKDVSKVQSENAEPTNSFNEKSRTEDCVQAKNAIEVKKDAEITTEQSSNKDNNMESHKEREDCVHMTTNKHPSEVPSKDCVEPEQLRNNPTSKNSVPTKRRIPLITLSSPKHKKK
ncbi:chromatin assembly factor 1 subunit B [Asbolus verrucosus]|uniref:Chromatin assembly factor 1 subunit B n=1 Tax=Asbolus verrucosus TaxID=1661398 RepID=A0A482VLM2_ASBVE|nr:chromatin assembly factor 1 subunit B [Asbolus verrucosus]